MKTVILFALLFPFFCIAGIVDLTNKDGRTIKAELTNIEADSLTFKKDGSESFTIPLSVLSDESLDVVYRWFGRTSIIERSNHLDDIPIDELTTSHMEKLGAFAATGDFEAVCEIEYIRSILYSSENGYTRERNQVNRNISLIDAALAPIGEAAAEGSNDAMGALKYAGTFERLRAFISKPLGTAGIKGNEEAIEMLVNHESYGIIASKAVEELADIAGTNNPQAVIFLASAISKEKYKIQTKEILRGLASASLLGNQLAIHTLSQNQAGDGNSE